MEYSVPSGISAKPEEKVILVGHSLGGLVISKAMQTFPEKISVAVFVTALMPKRCLPLQGSTGDSVYTHDEGVKNMPSTFVYGPNYMSSTLYNLSPPEVKHMKDMLKEIAMSKQKYGSVKRLYIISEQDKVISKEFQHSIIDKDPTDEVKEITGSDHMVMISQPQQLFFCLQENPEKAFIGNFKWDSEEHSFKKTSLAL
ncbi:hypothetical protein MKX01_024776 [Papaver californicum]|nr:hypothetical protein MKX01_024776 [Papaver californicum]